MKKFNKLIEGLMNGVAPDTDDGVGNFGAIDASDAQPTSTKIVLHMDSGIEIHIPTDVCKDMLGAIEGEIQPEMPVPAVEPHQDGETEEEHDKHEEAETDEDEAKEHEESDKESDEDSEDDDKKENKSTALTD